MTIPGPLSVPTYLMLGIIVGLTGTVAYQCGVARQSRVSLLPVSTAVPVTSPAAVPPQSAPSPPLPPDEPLPADPRPTTRETVPPPALDPPTVQAILVADERRLAFVDGRVVRVGAVVGDLRVVTIADDHIVLQNERGDAMQLPLHGIPSVSNRGDDR